MTPLGTCNGGSGDLCRGFGYRIHQSGPDCPELPMPSDSQFVLLTRGQQETARAYWRTRIDQETDEYKTRRLRETLA